MQDLALTAQLGELGPILHRLRRTEQAQPLGNRVGGKISMIGNLSGPATEFNPGLVMAKRANLQGISIGSTQMFEAMNRAITAGAMKPSQASPE